MPDVPPAVISLLIGVLALAPTIYNMALYDTVIPAESTKGMIMLFVGVCTKIIALACARRTRTSLVVEVFSGGLLI